LWLPKDDLRDSSSWSSPPLMLLRDIHSKLITLYDFKEVCAPSQSHVNAGAGARLRSQDGVSHQQETVPLIIPHLNLLFGDSFETYICGSRRAAEMAGLECRHSFPPLWAPRSQ
jgi:hypothetical protein